MRIRSQLAALSALSMLLAAGFTTVAIAQEGQQVCQPLDGRLAAVLATCDEAGDCICPAGFVLVEDIEPAAIGTTPRISSAS